MEDLSEGVRSAVQKCEGLGCEFHFTHDLAEPEGPTFFVSAKYEGEQIASGRGFNYDQAAAAAYMEIIDFFREQGRIIST